MICFVYTLTVAYPYWKPKHEEEFYKILTISPQLKQEAKKLLFDIAKRRNISLESRKDSIDYGLSPKRKSNQPTLVGIHVRRGDKVRSGWILPGKDYFVRAMDHFRAKYKNVYFVVVSEDKNYIKQNIVGANVLRSTAQSDILEFTLLTLCDHTIMSVGTFSWWAAYLTGGDVVYYREHMPKTGRLANFHNDSQYFLPEWKPMV